jgi:hypothetical protein
MITHRNQPHVVWRACVHTHSLSDLPLSPVYHSYRLRGSKHIFPTLSELVAFYADQVRPPFKHPLRPIESFLRRQQNAGGQAAYSPTDHSPSPSPNGMASSQFGFSPASSPSPHGSPEYGAFPAAQKAKAYSTFHYNEPKPAPKAFVAHHKHSQPKGKKKKAFVEHHIHGEPTTTAPQKSPEKAGRRRKFADKMVSRQKQSSGASHAATPTPPATQTAYVRAREGRRKRNRHTAPTAGANIYTIMLQTEPAIAALECDAHIHLKTASGETVTLDLADADLLETTSEPVYQLHGPPVGNVASVTLTKKKGIAFELVGLHISSTAGIAFRIGGQVAFSSRDTQKQIPSATSLPRPHVAEPTAGPVDVGTGDYSTAPSTTYDESADVHGVDVEDVAAAAAASRDAMREQLRKTAARETADQTRRGTHEAMSEALTRELDVQVQKMSHLEEAWLAELQAEEERVLGAMESTEQAIDALHTEDVGAGLMVREFETYIERLERQRDELRQAVDLSQGTLSQMSVTKEAEEQKVVAFDTDIEAATRTYLIEKEKRDTCRRALQVLEHEQRACDTGLTQMEAEASNFAAEEALSRSALVEEEDRLAQLLIEEQELLSFSRTKEMEEASKLAKQHLEALERNRALRELSEQDTARSRSVAVVKRTSIQHLLEADIVGLDDVINSGSAGLSDETRLAAAESQVRMLEEKLRIADAHLSFAEATSDMLSQYPNSTGVLLGELQRYESHLANAGFLDDGELSEFDSDHDDGGYLDTNPESDDGYLDMRANSDVRGDDNISLFDEPLSVEEEAAPPSPEQMEADDARGLYAKLQEQAGGQVLIRHVRFVVTKVFPIEAQTQFNREYSDTEATDAQPVSQPQLLQILRDLYKVRGVMPPPIVTPRAQSPGPRVARKDDDEDYDGPHDDEDVEYGFGEDGDDENEFDDEGGAAAHIQRVMHVWKMRSDQSPSRPNARRISTQLKIQDFG